MATYLDVSPKKKPVSRHLWESRIKAVFARKVKYAHNSVTSNLEYPKEKVKQQEKESKGIKDKFTVIGSSLTKEFLFCKDLVQGLHWCKPKVFDAPKIKGVTAVEWPQIWNDMKVEYGNLAYSIHAPVVVLINGKYLGGPSELEMLLKESYKFVFRLNLDYYKESVKEFAKLCNSTNRPHVYLNFSLNGAPIGCMIFVLYADLVPRTCENFIRLCTQSKGGYKGTPVHRIVKDCWIQCGGFGLKSIDLNCENFIVNFDRRGVIGMANAERHVDCSTQFFVISQAAEWMNTQYVAFGQLIEGEKTLQTIEKSPTWYESPTQEITICSAGILNMECHDIAINKTAKEYIASHIENTIKYVRALMEKILDMVFEDAHEKSRLRRQEEKANVFDSGICDRKSIHSRKHSSFDLENKVSGYLQVMKSNDNTLEVISNAGTFSYHARSSTTEVSERPVDQNRLFYFPLTDVKYPGEIDSTTDVKRFLQGKYCLEADVDDSFKSKPLIEIPKIPLDISEQQDIMVLSAGSPDGSSDSELERRLNAYYKKVGETKSFSRKVMKNVAKSLDFYKLTDALKAKTVIADEELRKIKLTAADVKSALEHKKRISINVEATRVETNRSVKRRQTGFVRGEDLKSLLSLFDKDDSEDLIDDDEDDYDNIKDSQSTKFNTHLVEIKHNTEDHKPRKSALTRLINDVDQYSVQGSEPTLRNYQPTLGEPKENTPMFLRASAKIEDNENDFDFKILMHRPLVSRSSHELVTCSNHPKPSVKLNKFTSIRKTEFEHTRPTLSIKEYRERNRKTRHSHYSSDFEF